VAYRLWPRPLAQQRISADEAHDLARAGRIVLIDIRRPDEWARTGVPDHGVPIDMRRTDFMQAVQAAAGGKPVALICARGVRSRKLARQFEDAGITSVIDVSEGMLGSAAGPGWLAKSLPVQEGNG
jgi:rhodanese-related sulfurtransferase